MDVNDSPSGKRQTGAAPPPATAAGQAAASLDARIGALRLLGAAPSGVPGGVVERQPILRLAPGRGAAVAAERLVVSRRALAAELGLAGEADEDLLRYAEDRVAARLSSGSWQDGKAVPAFGGLPARVPALLPLPLRPNAVPAPRPGLIGVLPLAAAAVGRGLGARRAELAACGWRLGIGELDAAAWRFVAPEALDADLVLLRWSAALAERRDALRGADPHALVLVGCDGPDAVEWGWSAGLALFSGPGAKAMVPAATATAEASP